MNLVSRFLTYCRLTCLGGSSAGECPCKSPTDCTMKGHPQYEKYSSKAGDRICRFGQKGLFSIATDFTRFPAGRRKADGPHSGEHLREVVLQRLQEGPLTVLFDGTMGYGSSFLEGAFKGLSQEVPVDQLTLHSEEDPSLVIECWGYINS